MQQEVKVGMRFVRLEVARQLRPKYWECQCDCGNIKNVYTSQLLEGNNTSCGCMKKDVLVKRNTSHGMSKRSEYSNWKGMLKRCFNVNDKRYESYAGRGITVHEDFVKDFSAWFAEIGEKPMDGQRWSVGRKDNDVGYTYGNMRWEIDEQQARNHTMQANNSSGIVGVAIRTTTIAGVDYPAWVACWNTLDGKKRTKNFSINKYGKEGAKALAVAHRNKMITELNSQGAEYADSHGSEK